MAWQYIEHRTRRSPAPRMALDVQEETQVARARSGVPAGARAKPGSATTTAHCARDRSDNRSACVMVGCSRRPVQADIRGARAPMTRATSQQARPTWSAKTPRTTLETRDARGRSLSTTVSYKMARPEPEAGHPWRMPRAIAKGRTNLSSDQRLRCRRRTSPGVLGGLAAGCLGAAAPPHKNEW